MSDLERWELYRTLNLRIKLNEGQAYLESRQTSSKPPPGDFPEDARSQMVNIKLTVNDYLICIAHQYVRPNGPLTGPDPKYFQIDDLRIRE